MPDWLKGISAVIVVIGFAILIVYNDQNKKINAESEVLESVEKSFCNLDGKQNEKAEVWWFQPSDRDQDLEKRYRCIPN